MATYAGIKVEIWTDGLALPIYDASGVGGKSKRGISKHFIEAWPGMRFDVKVYLTEAFRIKVSELIDVAMRHYDNFSSDITVKGWIDRERPDQRPSARFTSLIKRSAESNEWAKTRFCFRHLELGWSTQLKTIFTWDSKYELQMTQPTQICSQIRLSSSGVSRSLSSRTTLSSGRTIAENRKHS